MAYDDELLAGLQAHEPLQVSVGRMRDAARLRRVLAELVLQWRQEKHRRDVVDFTDQTRLALQVIREFPVVAHQVREQSGVVLLDEYQDTSLAQRLLLQGIFGDGHPVNAVGDPCQGIYGWRGASVDNIESFPKHFPVQADEPPVPSRRYQLSVNRRSGKDILDVANEVFTDLRAQHDGVLELVPGRQDAGPGAVECGLFETADDERAWIVERIRALGKAAWGLPRCWPRPARNWPRSMPPCARSAFPPSSTAPPGCCANRWWSTCAACSRWCTTRLPIPSSSGCWPALGGASACETSQPWGRGPLPWPVVAIGP
jgi:superfamily I DNA/RNA helicase